MKFTPQPTVLNECGTYMDNTDVTHGVWAGEYLNRPAKSYAQASRKPSIRVQAERNRKANG